MLFEILGGCCVNISQSFDSVLFVIIRITLDFCLHNPIFFFWGVGGLEMTKFALRELPYTLSVVFRPA